MKTLLVVGNGGREHALCWKLAQSEQVTKIYCAPGNGGTATESKTENIAIAVDDFDALIDFAKHKNVDFVVIGPDNPLAEGIVDTFQAENIPVFGPTQQAARLESSKVFSKRFMEGAGLLTAPFEVFDNPESAFDYCAQSRYARVIKVDGLALGKGVYVCDTLRDCELALHDIFSEKKFGESGAQVVIEDRMHGPEISLLVLSDGKTLLPLTSSQDYKRRFEGNKGPNTGGMGVYSPVPLYEAYEEMVQELVLTPLSKALEEADFTFQGLLYIGLMMHHNKPHILEFNARFGDPETQCILPRMQSDLLPLLEACNNGTLAEYTIDWKPEPSVCVVLCADTYPDKGSRGVSINIGNVAPDVTVFHAGTSPTPSGDIVTAGGRVLNVVATGKTHEEATQKAYDAIPKIRFEGMGYRTDIAKDVSVCHLK